MSKTSSRETKGTNSTNSKPSTADPRQTEWKNFFLDSGIPEHAASEYASIFVKERINWPILKNLDKGYLTDMGINTIGDQISILQAAKRYSGEQYAPGTSSPPKSFTLAPMRMDTEEPLPTRTVAVPSSVKLIEPTKLRSEITTPEPTVASRIGKSEVSSTTALRSFVKHPGDSKPTVVLVRSKRPAEEDDIRERAIVKRLSALPPKQVHVPSPADRKVMFNVRLGPGPTAKRDVFSRLTPKGVKTSGNTNLVHVIESKMSRLSTSVPAPAERDKPIVATLVSDTMDATPSSQVFTRLGSSDNNVRNRLGNVPAPAARSNSSSTVFSRLGFSGTTGGRSQSQNNSLPPGDLRQRLNIKDRLGVRR